MATTALIKDLMRKLIIHDGVVRNGVVREPLGNLNSVNGLAHIPLHVLIAKILDDSKAAWSRSVIVRAILRNEYMLNRIMVQPRLLGKCLEHGADHVSTEIDQAHVVVIVRVVFLTILFVSLLILSVVLVHLYKSLSQRVTL